MIWLDTLVQGLLLGGLYALFAAGLSLVFGIMRLVNLAHGDLIVLAAYIALVCVDATGMAPLTSLLIVVPVMAVIGYALQRGVLNLTLGDDILPPLLVTFGISIILQNLLLEVFSADSQKLQSGWLDTASIELGDSIAIGLVPLIIFLVAIVVIGGLQLLFYRTKLGRAFRATSDDQDTARLMGIDNRHVFALAMAISLAVSIRPTADQRPSPAQSAIVPSSQVPAPVEEAVQLPPEQPSAEMKRVRPRLPFSASLRMT